eukprot:TRINITY_DN122_c0_g1_i3.p1 TRINITY_DN122_c0_g1~~TRINITY_DN122_c0_g1_i3.p1  ORF type:complete len:135 (-),score=33.42 TRINITY_DN122_c0_g1_i3:56-460(-)
MANNNLSLNISVYKEEEEEVEISRSRSRSKSPRERSKTDRPVSKRKSKSPRFDVVKLTQSGNIKIRSVTEPKKVNLGNLENKIKVEEEIKKLKKVDNEEEENKQQEEQQEEITIPEIKEGKTESEISTRRNHNS